MAKLVIAIMLMAAILVFIFSSTIAVEVSELTFFASGELAMAMLSAILWECKLGDLDI